MPQHNFLVKAEDAKKRLDVYLTEQLNQISRSQISKLIKQKQVLVNSEPVKSGYILEEKDKISVDSATETHQEIELIAEDIPLDIVYEDDDLIVINKAAGMVVHPGNANATGTLVNALLHHSKHVSKGSAWDRPGIVHRLDKDTSGLIVCAKNDHAHHLLAKQFEEKNANRVYIAICWHQMTELQGIVETDIGRHPKQATAQAVLPDGRGKHAITRFKVMETYPFITLAKFKLSTGRTHQIRVHCKHLGHPVFADTLYSGDDRQSKSIHLHYQKFARQLLKYTDRQCLHAYHLDFEHPVTKERLSFEVNLPEDFKLILDKLRNKYPEYECYEEFKVD